MYCLLAVLLLQGDPDALLASTLALLLLFSEGSSSWGTAPLQLPLEEVVAGLAAAIQRDDKLSALLRGPAGARPGGLEQQVLGLVSQAAFRPYFVLQSTQVSIQAVRWARRGGVRQWAASLWQ